MGNPLEIIVSTAEAPHARSIKFEGLKKVTTEEHVNHVLLLWDTNSYLLNIQSREFHINGGRPLRFNGIGDKWEFDYRRRTIRKASVNGRSHDDVTQVLWLIGLKGNEHSVYLQINEEGTQWEFLNKL